MVNVLLTHRAERDIAHLSRDDASKVKHALRLLSQEPLKGEALIGPYKGLRRYRVGNFRIIYELIPKTKCITVIKVGHRKDVYR